MKSLLTHPKIYWLYYRRSLTLKRLIYLDAALFVILTLAVWVKVVL